MRSIWPRTDRCLTRCVAVCEQIIRFLNIEARAPHSIATEVPVSLLGLDLIKYVLSAALFLDMKPQVGPSVFCVPCLP